VYIGAVIFQRCRAANLLVLVGGVLLPLASGCPQWEPGPPEPAPDGVIDIPAPNVTFDQTGGSVDFRGRVTCPPEMAPCTYRWDFGDGRISTVKDPGPTVFSKLGYYRVTFTVTSTEGRADPTPGEAHVAVWNGEFQDSFERPSLDFDRHGWRHPIHQDAAPYHDIENGWLRIRGDYHLPGSTALVAYPLVGDCHIEVTKRRHPNPAETHFTDVIVRMHPSLNNGSFIRVRIQEERASVGNFVEVGVFKIMEATDEHGWLINDEILHHELHHIDCIPAPQYGMCPSIDQFPRTEDIRITIDVAGNRITTRLAAASNPGTVLLTAAATDDIGTPYLYPGAVGVAQYEGVTHLDNFVMRRTH
jgi:hypothetical protein